MTEATSEIGKIIIAVIILVVLIFGVIFLLSGKGSEVLEAIRNLMRFGK
ncbi:MAG: hypothetical protein WC494_02985 [Candidatus Pacearchaeota archaeon]